MTTLGNDASVATVKTEADCCWDPGPAYEPLPHPAMTAKGSNSKRIWTHFNLLISVSFLPAAIAEGGPLGAGFFLSGYKHGPPGEVAGENAQKVFRFVVCYIPQTTEPTVTTRPTAILLISCPDQKGLVARISEFLFQNNGNIVHADNHIDAETGLFLMRVEWELDGFQIPRPEIAARFAPLAERLQMHWRIHFSDAVQRIGIFVSKYGHCLHDLLLRNAAGELPGSISLVIGNHPDLQTVPERFGIPFHVFPIRSENKREQEQKELELLENNQIDLVVLARYMQVLGPEFANKYSNRIINIHHSFLPAFVGSRPYHQAYDRGVKLIGATSHYVTEQLDDGPIIEQDIVRISHRDSVDDLIRKGRDLERVVLARAVHLHLGFRVLPYGRKTAIFD
jgi:formyltetrahydrofolate deformylase